MKPLKMKVAVQPKGEENTTSSGIEFVTVRTSKYSEGTVVEIGEGVTQVKKGDQILYSPLAYEEIADNQHIVHEDDIHAILTE